MPTEPEHVDDGHYQCAFPSCTERVTPSADDWVYKRSAMFSRSYRYHANHGEYYIEAPVEDPPDLTGAVASSSKPTYAYICHTHSESYTLVRVSEGISEDTLDKEVAGSAFDVLSIVPLPYGSLELVVRKLYVPSLTEMLKATFPAVSVDPDHDPSEPSSDAISRLGYNKAKCQAIELFSKRAEEYITGDFWPTARGYYSHLVGQYGEWTRSNH